MLLIIAVDGAGRQPKEGPAIPGIEYGDACHEPGASAEAESDDGIKGIAAAEHQFYRLSKPWFNIFDHPHSDYY
jgi:hypothetical protein